MPNLGAAAHHYDWKIRREVVLDVVDFIPRRKGVNVFCSLVHTDMEIAAVPIDRHVLGVFFRETR